jgi:hypothetical protein
MKNEDGFVLPFVAILLMVLFLVGGIILDAGSLYLRHGQLHHLAKQSANAGMLEFVSAMEAVADENKSEMCAIDEPPPLCASVDMFDFLSSGEIVDAVSSPLVQADVENASTTFALTYDAEEIILSEDVSIIFPYEFSSPSDIQIQVTITATPDRFLGGIFPVTENEIEVSAVSYIATPF